MNEPVNDASMNVSDNQQPDEEAHDIVHDLQGQVPTAQGGIESAAVIADIDQYSLQRRRSQSNTNVQRVGSGYRSKENEAPGGSFKEIDEMRFSNVEEEDENGSGGYFQNVKVVRGYTVNMEASY